MACVRYRNPWCRRSCEYSASGCRTSKCSTPLFSAAPTARPKSSRKSKTLIPRFCCTLPEARGLIRSRSHTMGLARGTPDGPRARFPFESALQLPLGDFNETFGKVDRLEGRLFCRYPPRLHRVGSDVIPAASDGKCQQNIAELALRVCRRPTPGSLGPQQIVHSHMHTKHAGAQVNQSFRSFDQCRQNVGGERFARAIRPHGLARSVAGPP